MHGSPGSWKSFAHFLNHKQLRNQLGILIVDRPGFGLWSNQGSVKDLQQQSKMMNAILIRHLDASDTLILVGHSYGGSLIAHMAIDLESSLNINALYFLAAALDPNLEKTKWFQYPAQWWLFQWFIPRPLIHSNQEILHLKQDLIELQPDLQRIQQKNIFVLHGNQDQLVPVENVSYYPEQYV